MKNTTDMSLAEYFTHKGLKEAKHIEVTLEDGSKVAITGRVALMWWRLVHLFLKSNNSGMRHENVYKFRSVDKEGNTRPHTIEEMIELHDWSTGICSSPSHMRSISETYMEIIERGEAALSAIFEYLKDNNCGMNIILLLEDITKTSPYQPEETIDGFHGYTVRDCVTAWLEWGRNKNYIK